MSVDLKIATEISCCITAFRACACKISEAMIKQKLTTYTKYMEVMRKEQHLEPDNL